MPKFGIVTHWWNSSSAVLVGTPGASSVLRTFCRSSVKIRLFSTRTPALIEIFDVGFQRSWK
jgi:hypothetical protein